MKKILAAAALALAMAGMASSASAAIITWTLTKVTFDDGGAATGTFDTDSDTGLTTAFDISVTDGTTLSAFHYIGANSFVFAHNYFTSNSFLVVKNDFGRYVNLTFTGPLTSPGVVNLVAYNGGDGGSWECDNCNNVRGVTGGAAVSGAVPEPATWALMLIGFGGLGAVLRRRRTADALAA